MQQPAWYVVQVETGREQRACDFIAKACKDYDLKSNVDEPLISEVFAPRYRSQFKLHGEWHDEERLLLPGYVVAVTANPWELARVMYAIPGFTRILTQGETYAPLSDTDKSWLDKWTREGDRTIPMSFAYKEGDRVVVVGGPLEGCEFMISRINRRQSIAELEMKTEDGKSVKATVGLAVYPKDELESKLKQAAKSGLLTEDDIKVVAVK